MPLPQPILDDRSFQQLRDTLRNQITVFNPEWTDHNPADPGITFLELVAFLGENLLYRFNQIPEATRLAFLKLLDVPLRPASPARALITVGNAPAAGAIIEQGSPASAGETAFETVQEVVAFPFKVLAVAKASTTEPEGEAKDYADASAAAAKLDPELNEQPAYYVNATVPEDPGSPDAQIVDFGKSVDGILWIAVIAEETTDLVQMQGRLLNLGVAVDEAIMGVEDVDACPGDGTARATPETIWEYSAGLDANDEPIYRALVVEADTTRGLTQTGVVRLKLPASASQLQTFTFDDPDLPGTRALPPPLEDDELAEKVMFWIRAWRRKQGDRSLPKVAWVGPNVTEVVQTRTSRPAFLGIGTARANQEYRLIHRPVIAGSLVVEVEENGQFRPWEVVDTFEASGPNDRHAVLDAEAGVVRFGNTVKGWPPQMGERIRAREYRYGGGAAGNVAAKSIDKLEGHGTLSVGNPLAARGGADSEPLTEALDRVPSELRRRDRAMSSSDFRELALVNDGVGRADVLPLFHPRAPDVRAAGVVTVVIWPREDRKRPSAPMPDRTLLNEVCAYLDARRLITTELWVIPPGYKKVAVSIGLQVKPGFGVEAVRAWVELAVRQYLAPLPPYGPEGQGWPLGRAVNPRELEAAALQVEGVQFLQGLRLAYLDGEAWLDLSNPCEKVLVPLKAWEVPELAEITVVEGDPLAPGEALQPGARPEVPVPIPTLKEAC